MDISRMNGRVWIEPQAMRPGFFIRFVFRKDDKTMSITFDEKEMPGDAAYIDHESEALFISESMATELMNRLWAAGVRPVDYDSPGRVEAMSAHLSDCRKWNEELIPFVLEAAKGASSPPAILEVRHDSTNPNE